MATGIKEWGSPVLSLALKCSLLWLHARRRGSPWAELLFCKVWLSVHSVLRYLKCRKSIFLSEHKWTFLDTRRYCSSMALYSFFFFFYVGFRSATFNLHWEHSSKGVQIMHALAVWAGTFPTLSPQRAAGSRALPTAVFCGWGWVNTNLSACVLWKASSCPLCGFAASHRFNFNNSTCSLVVVVAHFVAVG